MPEKLTFDLARPWRSHPRETVGLGLLALVGTAVLATVVSYPGEVFGIGQARAGTAIPAPPNMTAVQPIAPEKALRLNGQLPLSSGPNPAAQPFILAGGEARGRALECLTSAIYYEAAQEPADGQLAVAQVILNRVRHPAFPASVCGVVYEGSTRQTGCQFTFTCDGSMTRAPVPALWNRARQVAEAALAGAVAASVGNATHYHANYVLPYWAPTLAKTAVIGTHLFYRWQGNWGRPAAFVQRYSGRESDPRLLRTVALSVDRAPVAPAVQAVNEQIAKLAEIPGAKIVEKDGKRVRVLFTPQAREAVEKAKVTPYVERVSASDNLRYALGGGASAGSDKPLGQATASSEPVKPAS